MCLQQKKSEKRPGAQNGKKVETMQGYAQRARKKRANVLISKKGRILWAHRFLFKCWWYHSMGEDG
jgi:hypothetical protein